MAAITPTFVLHPEVSTVGGLPIDECELNAGVPVQIDKVDFLVRVVCGDIPRLPARLRDIVLNRIVEAEERIAEILCLVQVSV